MAAPRALIEDEHKHGSDSEDSAVDYEEDDGAAFRPRHKQAVAKLKTKLREQDPHVEKERKHREALQMFVALLRSSKTYDYLAKQSKTDTLARSSTDRLAVEVVWMRYFNAMNYVATPLGISFSDVGLKAICWSLLTETPGHPDITECSIHWIAELFVQTSVFSCQHTMESMNTWPTAEEFGLYRRRIAAVVTRFFEVGESTGLDNLIRTIDDPMFQWRVPESEEDDPSDGASEQARKAFDRAEARRFDAFRKRYQQLCMPDRLKRQMEAEKAARVLKDARKERITGKKSKTAEAEIPDEDRGALWRNSSSELVLNFVPRASRLIYRVCFDEALLVRFKPTPNPHQFTEGAFDSARAWTRTKARIATEIPEVTASIRDLFCNMVAPLGTETSRYRDKMTSSDVTQNLLLLKAEIGVHLGNMLHGAMLHPVPDYLEAHEGQYWNAAFLAIMQLEMRQKLLLQAKGETWLEMYVVLHPQSDAGQQRMNADTFLMNRNKRPFLVFICRRWWVVHSRPPSSVLLICDNLLHAFLTWLRIIRLEHSNTVLEAEFASFDGMYARAQQAMGDDATKLQRYTLENGRNIRTVYDQFLDDRSVAQLA
jgi:hypothetical protein